MSPFLIIPLVALIELPFVLIFRSARADEARETALKAAETKRKEEDGVQVVSILRNALKALKNNRAAGYRPFVACLLEKVRAGEDIEPETARRALELTLGDLKRFAPRPEDFPESTRDFCMKKYDFSYLHEFIGALAKMEAGA